MFSKQLLVVAGLVFVGTAGSFVLSPVYGVAVYYFFAVLRPQTLWDWALPPDVRWSYYVAVSTLLATVLWRTGLYAPARAATAPWYGEPKWTRTHWLFLAFAVWITLSVVAAVRVDRAWEAYQDYLKIFVMFVCATFVLRTARELWVIYVLAIGAAVFFSYEVNFKYVTERKNLFISQVDKDGWDNNALGLMLAMVITLLYFAWEGTRHWARWAFLAVVPVVLHAVLLSYSRGAMLALVVVAPLVLWRARNKGFIAVVFAGVFACVVVMAGKEIQERFFSIQTHNLDASANSRKTTWLIAVRMATEKPVFGFGVRNSNLFTRSYGADMEGRTIHSVYLQIAADSGWVATGLYVAMLGSAFLGLRQVRRALRRWDDPETRRVKAMASGLECALVVFCFGGVFLSLEVFEMPYIMLLLSVQLHAITRAVVAKLEPAAPAVAAAAQPVPLPARPVAVPEPA